MKKRKFIILFTLGSVFFSIFLIPVVEWFTIILSPLISLIANREAFVDFLINEEEIKN